MSGAVPEPETRGDRKLTKLALESHRTVVGRHLRVELLLLDAGFATARDPGANRLHLPLEGLVGLGAKPGVGQLLLERRRATEVAEDDVELPDDQLEEPNLLIEQQEDVRLDGALRGEVHDVCFAGLPDAVDASDALLDDHRVPR